MKENITFYLDINGYEIRTIVTDPLWKQNCYLITKKKSGEQILIDPGLRADNIINTIKENGSGILTSILLTHAHFDHIGAVKEISGKFNVPCTLHERDYKLLRQATMYVLRFGGKHFNIPDDVVTFSESPEGDYTNSFGVTTILAPGHTKGSVCYRFDGFVFTGDTLLHENVGRADLPGSDLDQLRESIDKLIAQESEDIIIFSGHGGSWTMKEAKSWWKQARLAMPQHNMFLK
jgi:hydroxyacylglutathione hydrolase